MFSRSGRLSVIVATGPSVARAASPRNLRRPDRRSRSSAICSCPVTRRFRSARRGGSPCTRRACRAVPRRAGSASRASSSGSAACSSTRSASSPAPRCSSCGRGCAATHDSHERALLRAAYRDRELFDYWCHEASLCHVADLPIHRWAMRSYVERLTEAKAVVRDWLEANAKFADHIVSELERDGPLRAREIEDHSEVGWEWGWWTDEVSERQNIARMLDRLWMQGRIGIGGRIGIERHWDLISRCLPPGALAAADDDPLDQDEVVRRATLRGRRDARRRPRPPHRSPLHAPPLSRARGVCSRPWRRRRAEPGRVDGLRGEWWVLPESLDRLGELKPGRRTIALSPFDNLIGDRARPPSCSASTTGSRYTSRRQAPLGLLRPADPARRAFHRARRPAHRSRRRGAAAPHPRPARGARAPGAGRDQEGARIAGPLARGRAGPVLTDGQPPEASSPRTFPTARGIRARNDEGRAACARPAFERRS